MISITEPAVLHLKSLVESDGAEGKGLRLFVEQGGCAGMQYGMTIDSAQDGDEVISQGGVQVIIDSESIEYLRGSVIDYSDDLTGTGFRIQNPNAVRSCGCGTSFESADDAATHAH